MVKRISTTAMLVAVFSLALALPAMAWYKTGTIYCEQGGWPNTRTRSVFLAEHEHRVNGSMRSWYPVQSVNARWGLTVGSVPYLLYVGDPALTGSAVCTR